MPLAETLPTEPDATLPLDLRRTVTKSAWYRSLARFEKSNIPRALGQLVSTLALYFGLWAAMIWMARTEQPTWTFVPPVLIAGGLLVRIFIFFHDCGHGSFFESRQANKIVGYLCGILTFTPYENWRHSHARHHTTVGDLDRRDGGDIWTMTTDEFRAATPFRQLCYRLFRHPVVLFLIGPPVMFLTIQRFPKRNASRDDKVSVVITNVAILAILAAAHFTIGLRTYFAIQFPVIWIAATCGLWLFYIQHQFQGVYWARHENWDPIRAALEGSSYYRLPRLLRWFSGNIGLHHVHHLKPRIPNYHLQECYDATPEVHVEQPLTLAESLKSISLHLWDEEAGRLISFGEHFRREAAARRA